MRDMDTSKDGYFFIPFIFTYMLVTYAPTPSFYSFYQLLS
jgi:hypothetical protein